MSMVRYTRKELNENFSDKQNAEIKCLLAKGTVPDDQLDLSDIPEITDWSKAVRHGQFYRPVKQQTSVRLDADVLAWLKAQGKGYQTRMNKILRQAMLKDLKNHSVHDKFHRTLILSGFCLLKIAKISLNSSFFPKPIKR